jgi:hypothetical protein
VDFSDLQPHIPANGYYKAEAENGSPDGDLGQISAMFQNSSLTDTDRVMLPKPTQDDILPPLDAPVVDPHIPADGDCKAKVEEDFPCLYSLPWIIRGPDDQIACVVYRRYNGRKHAGKNYPIGPPDYETVLKKGRGFCYHPCSGNPLLMAWFGVANPW